MAEKSANIIELNGKRYDARTGRIVSDSVLTSPKKNPSPAVYPVKPATVPVQASATSAKPATKPKHVVARTPGKNSSRHTAQKPRTLMRRSALKPQASASNPQKVTKVQTPLVKATTAISVQPKLSISGINPHRMRSAGQVQKSPAVQKFSTPVAFAKQTVNTSKQTPLVASPEATRQANKKAFFDKAIASANSHEHQQENTHITKKTTKVTKSFKRQKSVFFVAASASVLVVVGAFVAFSNMSTLELKVASMRAGVSVNLPSYQPEGFSKSGPVAFQAGKVTVAFTSNDNSGREYKLSQEKSNWNSETLYDTVSSANKTVQTVQQNGNTVYLYGNSEASWVSGGILHTITGNANLSADQLLKIASNV